MTKRRYKKSPIIEALIDIRLNPSPGRTLDSLRPVRERISSLYPKQNDIFKLEGRIELGQPVSQHQAQTGFRFETTDGKHIAQMRVDGFTFSRLAPYEDWEPFEAEARRLWVLYRQCADPLHCIRSAVRYINRIDIKEIPAELKDYFRTYAEVSADMPQTLDGFAMQLLIPQGDGVMLSLIQASVPAPTAGIASINLDLDLFKESQTQFDNDETIWRFLNSLNTMAYQSFESCITDKTRALID